MDNLNNTSVETTETNTETTETTEPEVYTKEEVLKLIQSESDKRVTAALKTQAKKYEQKLSLSQLDGDERAKAEKDAEIADLREQLAAFQIDKNRAELKSVLQSRNLDVRFADIITITDDIEASQANIDMLDKLFKESVKLEVERRLAGTAPKTGGTTAEITKDSAKKMSVAELAQLRKTNPELYNNLYK